MAYDIRFHKSIVVKFYMKIILLIMHHNEPAAKGGKKKLYPDIYVLKDEDIYLLGANSVKLNGEIKPGTRTDKIYSGTLIY